MAKFTPPDSWRGVLSVMQSYCKDCNWSIGQTDLELIAAQCFNHYEGIGWMSGKQPIKFWPSVAKKWLIQEVRKGIKPATPPVVKPQEERIDDSIRRRQELRNRLRSRQNE